MASQVLRIPKRYFDAGQRHVRGVSLPGIANPKCRQCDDEVLSHWGRFCAGSPNVRCS